MIKNSEKILNLIARAKNDDAEARNELWDIYQDVIRNAHNFSRMGYRCGHKSAMATRFEDDMYRLLNIFMNAIRKYDPDMSSFATFLSNEIKYRGMDKVREKPPVEVPVGDLGGNGDEILKKIPAYGSDSDNSTGYGYYASETEAERKIRRLINLYPEGNARHNFLEAYLQAARECDGMGKDPKTKRICEILGCTRANCSSLAKAIRKDGLNHGIILRLLA